MLTVGLGFPFLCILAFRVLAVRIDFDYMEPANLKSNRVARLPGGRLSLDS